MASSKTTAKPESSIGAIVPRDIAREMEESYLNYAMSVIVARALPDVRDGLKPVHRRILYAMHEMGLSARARFRKSAAIVGEVLGKYHPHGDAPVYDALVRMAQDFSLRYPLIEGQGNFGSIDGDSPAAMRYSEARMSSIAEELLKDIEKETVDFQENYDGTRREPKVLPTNLPQLLLNGTVGIAVGMSSYIPPHNLTEVLRALIALIDNPEADDKTLLTMVPGPDFPTGGIIYGKSSLKELYTQGKGSFILRGVAEIEEERGKTRIIVSAIPFQVQKSTLIESIAEMVQNKKFEGIRDLRDESDKEGMRVVIELKTDAEPQKILNNLFRFTDLQKTIHASFLALEAGIQPRIMTLREMLLSFLAHREEVVRRRSRFDLARAQERAHILEGLVKALDNIDEVINTIKRSDSREEASLTLQKKFGLSAIQAQAILDMRLAALARLERTKIEEELKEKKRIIKELTLLLKDAKLLKLSIKKEFEELLSRHHDARRTKIIAQEAEVFQEEDLIADEETIIVLTSSGYIKRLRPELIRVQRRGGKGVTGMETKEEDIAQHLLSARSHARVFFASERGRIFAMKAWEIAEGSRTTKGKLLRGLLPLGEEEKIAAVLTLQENNKDKKTSNDYKFLVMISERGIIKRTPLEEFANVRKNGIRALGLKEEDRLRWAHFSSGEDDIMIATRSGKVLRFREKDLRPLSRSAAGVAGIRLQDQDRVIGMGIVAKGGKEALTFTLTDMGFAKKSAVKDYRLQRRGGLGIKTARISPSSGKLACFEVLDPNFQELVIISEKGQIIRIPIASIPKLSRTARGVRVMKLAPEDKIAGVTFL